MKPLPGLLLSLSLALPAAFAADTVTIEEWPVPWNNTRPRDPAVGPQGRVWFVGQTGDYVAYFNPDNGEFQRYDLQAGDLPHNLVVGKDGIVWYAGNGSAHIGRLDPASGEITRYPMSDPAASDPHTLVFDHDGNLWFTVQRGNYVGKLDTQTGEMTLLAVPTPYALPYGIIVDPLNRPWFAEFGANKLGMIEPATMELREFELPRADSRPRRLAATSDGAIWYSDYVQGYLGRLTPGSGAIKEWPAPALGNARPYALVADGRDRLWLVETGPQPSRLVGFDPADETFFALEEIPSGGAVRHMDYHRPTATLWFGTDTNTIGRAQLP